MSKPPRALVHLESIMISWYSIHRSSYMSQACLSIYYCILEWPTLEECALHTAPFYCTTHIHWRSVQPHFTALLTYTGGVRPPHCPILLHYLHTLEECALHMAPFYCTTHIHWRSMPSTLLHFTALLTYTGGACPPHSPILLHYSGGAWPHFTALLTYTGGACPPYCPILLHYSHTLEERALHTAPFYCTTHIHWRSVAPFYCTTHTLEERVLHTPPFYCTTHIHWRSVPSTRPHFTALLTYTGGACPPHAPILLHYSHTLEERALRTAPFYCTTHIHWRSVPSTQPHFTALLTYTGGACPPHSPILLHYSQSLLKMLTLEV